MKLPSLLIKNFRVGKCIVQGGMGVGVIRDKEAVKAITEENCLCTLSSAGLRTLVSIDLGRKVDTYTAVRIEIEKARTASGGKPIAINVMCALVGDYEETIRAAIDGGVDAIVSGAGLPRNLPRIQPPGHTALIPIVSSARALEILLKLWKGYRPDAVILEGPLAGGHLGFKPWEISDPNFALEKLLIEVLEVASKYGNIPVIVAGGIYTYADIVRFLALGASGVQLGTRFLATHESSATPGYKQAVVSARPEDLIVTAYPDIIPASPCGLPFRAIKGSPALQRIRVPKCSYGYVLQKGPDGKLSVCQAMPSNPNCQSFFCICNGLLPSVGYGPEELSLYTAGTNAYRVDKIISVKELVRELSGE